MQIKSPYDDLNESSRRTSQILNQKLSKSCQLHFNRLVHAMAKRSFRKGWFLFPRINWFWRLNKKQNSWCVCWCTWTVIKSCWEILLRMKCSCVYHSNLILRTCSNLQINHSKEAFLAWLRKRKVPNWSLKTWWSKQECWRNENHSWFLKTNSWRKVPRLWNNVESAW